MCKIICRQKQQCKSKKDCQKEEDGSVLSLSTQHTQNNSRPVSEQGESNPITSNKATQIVCKRQHLPPVPISNRRQSYANSAFYKKKKNPSCNFLQVGSDHKNHSASVLKGHRKMAFHKPPVLAVLHRHDGYWEFPSGLLSTCGWSCGQAKWEGSAGHKQEQEVMAQLHL